jgi:2-hydroxychromene-2-carboxylate isomerase
MPSKPVLEMWFDFASTYSYPAAERVQSIAGGAGVEVAYRPFLLGPIFQKQGWNDSPFNIYPVKGAYMWRDLERTCASLGLPFCRPSVFPRNGLLAARVAVSNAEQAWCAAFVRAIYQANFAEDRDIGSRDVVVGVLAAVGLDGEDIVARAESFEQRPLLRRQTERAMELGIFGAPTFAVGGEVFWGNDRLEQAVAWAGRANQPVDGLPA